MIDLDVEKPITLSQARRLPFVVKDGKPVNLSTIWRWSSIGCRGVKLETVTIGGRACTTREAMVRFINALNTSPTNTPILQERSRQLDRAGHVLAAARI